MKLPGMPRHDPVDPSRVRVGTAGWSYADWEGIVYPSPVPPGFDRLEWMARFVDVVEINASFYRAPRAADARRWVAMVAGHPRFRFCAKLERVFTHQPGPASSEAERRFKAGVAPLAESGRLAALLVQFPYGFRNTADNRRHLAQVLTRFGDFRLAVELRHRTWLSADLLAFLGARGVALVGIDQPQVGQPIPPSLPLTAPFFYARFHGRNAADWFRPGAGRDARYNYLYAPAELTPWVDRIRQAAAEGVEGVVIANNHYRGQAVVNAVEIRSALAGGSRAPAPVELLRTYPRLEATASPLPPAAGSTGRLL